MNSKASNSDDRQPGLEHLTTHKVFNHPQEVGDQHLWDQDVALRQAVDQFGGRADQAGLQQLGATMGSVKAFQHGFDANENPPQLKAFDRYGRRLDRVDYHPSYHWFMSQAIAGGWHACAWQHEQQDLVGHIAAMYLLTQPEQGFCCPITMTHAVVPVLRNADKATRDFWLPKVMANQYDGDYKPAAAKAGVTFGMAMTEKQGGTDVRANTTVAERSADGFRLTGHKWFCSAPMSDAFLTLAQLPEGLSCFLVPRWQPDGSRNPFLIQRLKDKLGNRANASSEIEYQNTWATLMGEPGAGVKTIIEMVNQTRLDAATAPVGMMRQALAQVVYHIRTRQVFGKPLSQQPLMQRVVADMALEVEAALLLVMRIAQIADEGKVSLARFLTPIAKYWTNKRNPLVAAEAMECLGGIGYVEESILPRLFRESPVNSIWEGSGNVVCLDVLRSMAKQPDSASLVLQELKLAKGCHPAFDSAVEQLARYLTSGKVSEADARHVTEQLALCLQASLLARFHSREVTELFCHTRLGGAGGWTLGAMNISSDVDQAALKQLLERAGIEV